MPIGLAQFFWAARIIGGTLILGFVATTHEVGLYGSAQRILVALHTFVWLYFFNLLPSLSRAWRQERSSFADIIDRSLRLVVWVGVGAAVLGVLLVFAGLELTLPAWDCVERDAFFVAVATACGIIAVNTWVGFVVGLLAAAFLLGPVAASKSRKSQ